MGQGLFFNTNQVGFEGVPVEIRIRGVENADYFRLVVIIAWRFPFDLVYNLQLADVRLDPLWYPEHFSGMNLCCPFLDRERIVLHL